MRKYITDNVKNCAECIRYKGTNQKCATLLQTSVSAQCFENVASDFFGPLSETNQGMKWIFIVEDCMTKWVELLPLKQATAKECTLTLLNEVFLKYGLPHCLISNNETQFASVAMQQFCFKHQSKPDSSLPLTNKSSGKKKQRFKASFGYVSR